ncbi:MAG: hypothetical protein GQ569_05385 [Methylococcaceae bacterium]|nr:hypothetical protein [Methylococcaceae bacterium]
MLGLIIAILAFIDQLQPTSIIGQFIGLEQVQAEKTPTDESPVAIEKITTSEPTKKLKVSSSPFQYTLQEHQPQFIKNAKSSLSITFQNLAGEDFVKLNIAPVGEKSSSYAILDGYTEDFKSAKGLFTVQILSIDYNNKKVIVQVSRKS